MAEKNSYPQIPSTVWWGIRGVLQRSPNLTSDERNLGVQLNVQDAAARQYLTELKRVGLLTEEGRATPVAQRWRNDETYWEAAQEIVRTTYPENLVDLAPPGEGDRQKIVSWFSRDGLGTGTANNKAATYLLIGSRSPNEAPSRNPSAERSPSVKKTSEPKPTKKRAEEKPTPDSVKSKIHTDAPLLNLNRRPSTFARTDLVRSTFAPQGKDSSSQPLGFATCYKTSPFPAHPAPYPLQNPWDNAGSGVVRLPSSRHCRAQLRAVPVSPEAARWLHPCYCSRWGIRGGRPIGLIRVPPT